MLVITRKENESIIIDLGEEQIEIEIMEHGKQVRLGITAPQNYKIWRKELYTTVQQNRQALLEGEAVNIKSFLQSLNPKKPSK